MVLGGAAGVWRDVGRLEELLGRPWDGVVVACNEAGVDWPRELDHWASFHPEKFIRVCPPGEDSGDWVVRREERGHPGGFELWSTRADHIVDRVIDAKEGGSSGLLAVRVAQAKGMLRIALCGVPMTVTPHYHGAHGGRDWKHAAKHVRVWYRAKEAGTLDDVRSMSGRTQRVLGTPTREWLLGEEDG